MYPRYAMGMVLLFAFIWLSGTSCIAQEEQETVDALAKRSQAILLKDGDLCGLAVTRTLAEHWVKGYTDKNEPVGQPGYRQALSFKKAFVLVKFVLFMDNEEAAKAADFYTKDMAVVFVRGLWEMADRQSIGDACWHTDQSGSSALLVQMGNLCVLVSSRHDDVEIRHRTLLVIADLVLRKHVVALSLVAGTVGMDMEKRPGVLKQVWKKALGDEDLGSVQHLRNVSALFPADLLSVGDFQVTGTMMYTHYPFGIERYFQLVAKTGDTKLRIKVFIGASPADVREMLARSETLSSRPLELITAVQVRKGEPGDFHVTSKVAEKDKAPGKIYFARDNIGVSISAPKTMDVLPLAKEIDSQIKTAPLIKRQDYEKSVAIEILSAIPKQIREGSKTIIRYNNPSPDRLKVDLIVTAEPDGAIVISQGAEGVAVISARSVGHGHVGFFVYDPETLLSRAITHEIVVTPITQSDAGIGREPDSNASPLQEIEQLGFFPSKE